MFEAICQTSRWKRWSKVVFTGLVIIPGTLIATEVWPETPVRGGVPNIKLNDGWTGFLREHAAADQGIACLPFASGGKVQDFDVTTRWMCYGLKHGIPMVNGYSGFFPQSYMDLQKFVNDQFPSTQVLEKFRSMNVGHLVVARKYCSPEKLLQSSSESEQVRLTLVFEDPVGIDVYRLDKAN